MMHASRDFWGWMGLAVIVGAPLVALAGCASQQAVAAQSLGARLLECPEDQVRVNEAEFEEDETNWVAVCDFKYVSLRCDGDTCRKVDRLTPGWKERLQQAKGE